MRGSQQRNRWVIVMALNAFQLATTDHVRVRFPYGGDEFMRRFRIALRPSLDNEREHRRLGEKCGSKPGPDGVFTRDGEPSPRSAVRLLPWPHLFSALQRPSAEARAQAPPVTAKPPSLPPRSPRQGRILARAPAGFARERKTGCLPSDSSITRPRLGRGTLRLSSICYDGARARGQTG
jgi:hypothetical protein